MGSEYKGVLRNKTKVFAIRIINLYQYLSSKKKETVLSKQLLRAGTAIGALQREGEYAESPMDFIHKYAIAQKECSETIYWIELLYETSYLSKEEYESINYDAEELMKLLTSSIKTLKSKLITNH